MERASANANLDIKPVHIIAGLGAAERRLLAICLALFDDSKLLKRVGKLYESASSKVAEQLDLNKDQDERELHSAMDAWLDSTFTDDELRVLLWVRLREAMGLPPKLTNTMRGLNYLADDLTARLIHCLDPPNLVGTGRRWLCKQGWLEKDDQALLLADIVLPVLDEILQASSQADNFSSEPEARRRALSGAVTALNRLTDKEQQKLLKDIDADKLNDSAVLRTLAVGGSLGALGVGVSSAGFSAYILAAQASAFVPFVSGPGLVSLVSVLSNPITIIAATGGGAWYFARSSKRRINASVAARIVAMLVIRGLQSRTKGLEALRQSFATTAYEHLKVGASLKVLAEYQQEWHLLKTVEWEQGPQPSDELLEWMDKPLDTSDMELGLKPLSNAEATGDERINAAALAALTVGDVLYSVAAVDSTVIQAADFSRLAEIDGRVPFAQLAGNLLKGDKQSILGGISHLKGYVAEKAVAAELVSAGHTVSFPDTSNAPGYDILVDGEPFQVKFHADISGIERHFARYDYPVIANSELEGKIPAQWEDQVYFIDGLGNQFVTDVTERSLATGNQILEAGALEMVGVVSASRGLVAYRSGRISGRQAVEQVMLDGVVRASLFSAGGAAGSLAGGMLFGPAGAWVLGPGASILAQMQTPGMTRHLKSFIKTKEHKDWENRTHEALDNLREVIESALKKKREQLLRKMNAAPENAAGKYLRWRLSDLDGYTRECQLRLKLLGGGQWPIPEQRAAELFRLLSICAIFPAIYQRELEALSRLLKARPGLGDLLDKAKFESAWGKTQETSMEALKASQRTWEASSAREWLKKKLR